ncbi:hypothetical protein CYMTET_9264 [Cymbomonas tetramitiformis]|uniref:Uncharacterized protein n=1 Tax=Cymbomonas tetramitiformis TaxID=36881 RepID=A0AAE0LFN7_9CHLO|nr:hypothetical protein CYMTET_9264 [Cymbomonas tetramitiformis]
MGDKPTRFAASDDIELLAPLVVSITVYKRGCKSAGLDVDVFNLVDDPTREVVSEVNELLYDIISYVVERGSAAEGFLLGLMLFQASADG